MDFLYKDGTYFIFKLIDFNNLKDNRIYYKSFEHVIKLIDLD